MNSMKREDNDSIINNMYYSNDIIVDDITNNNIVSTLLRRDGSCPLHYTLIREMLEWVHDDLRFTLNRHGLGKVIVINTITETIINHYHHYHYNHHDNLLSGSMNEVVPEKLSIYAILNARQMHSFKGVLLGIARHHHYLMITIIIS